MLSGSRQSASCFSTSPDVPNLWKVHWNITVNILRQEYRNWWCEVADVFRSARTSWTSFCWPACLLVHNKNLDPLYTGIYASWIIKRLIKPTQWPSGIPYSRVRTFLTKMTQKNPLFAVNRPVIDQYINFYKILPSVSVGYRWWLTDSAASFGWSWILGPRPAILLLCF